MAVVAARRPRGTLRAGFVVIGQGIRREPGVFAIAMIGSVLFGALTVADAWVLGWATDEVVLPAFETGTTDSKALIAVVALFVGVALFRAAGIIARRVGAGIMQYRLAAHDRRAVVNQYLTLPMAWHQRQPTGQLLSIANSDAEATWSPIAPLPMALGTVAMMVIAVGQMYAADVVLATLGMLVFPAVVLINLGYQRIQAPLMMRAQSLRADVSEVAHESFDGALIVKTLGREAEETARFEARALALAQVNTRVGRIRAGFDPLLEALPSLGVLLVLLAGTYRVDSGATEPGDVVAVCYVLSISAFYIRSLGWLVGEFPRSVAGHERIQRILQVREQMPYGDQTLPRRAEGARLVCRGVTFAYVDNHVLRGLDLDVAPGRTVAVVGATASGKTTLVSLLARLVDPDSGTISVDGVELPALRRGALAQLAAVVPQQAFLFDDTVRGNLTLGGDFSDEQVWAALDVAQAVEFVSALPQGLDTPLGERGTSLSGGQRQRLSLARALVRHPALLIMDDATSAVDPAVESRILAGLKSGTGSTVVVVAYRKATIALADEVVFLQDGQIRAQGTHQQLLDAVPDYAELVNAYDPALEAAEAAQ